jgi:hypothetical protein
MVVVVAAMVQAAGPENQYTEAAVGLETHPQQVLVFLVV